jgi:hypothetical protein
MLDIREDGCGFVDAIRYAGRQVVRAPRRFVGAEVALAAADGPAGAMFATEVCAALPAKIDSVGRAGEFVIVRGAYTDGKLSVPFSREFVIGEDGCTVEVSETAEFAGLPRGLAVAGHKLQLPLVTDGDPHLRMLAFGCEHRVEMFRMDMNDVRRKEVNISDSRGYWPAWDIGAVLQLPGSYRVWKANHADTMAYPIDEGRGAPAWADYSELDWGVTAKVARPAATAPWALMIDARKGVLTFEAHPTSQPAVATGEYGKRRFSLTLTFHETSWPAEHPCELDCKLYARLLKDLLRREREAIVRTLATDDVDAIVRRERIQPSIALRSLYNREGEPMRRLLKRIGKDVPANRSLASWDRDAAKLLAWVRANGVPPAGAAARGKLGA